MAGLHEVARTAGLKDEEAAGIFEAVLAHCNAGERVTIKGFGTFTMIEYQSRVVRSPVLAHQGGIAEVPRYRRLKFKASKGARMALDSEAPSSGANGKAKGTAAPVRKPKKPKRRYTAGGDR